MPPLALFSAGASGADSISASWLIFPQWKQKHYSPMFMQHRKAECISSHNSAYLTQVTAHIFSAWAGLTNFHRTPACVEAAARHGRPLILIKQRHFPPPDTGQIVINALISSSNRSRRSHQIHGGVNYCVSSLSYRTIASLFTGLVYNAATARVWPMKFQTLPIVCWDLTLCLLLFTYVHMNCVFSQTAVMNVFQ